MRHISIDVHWLYIEQCVYMWPDANGGMGHCDLELATKDLFILAFGING